MLNELLSKINVLDSILIKESQYTPLMLLNIEILSIVLIIFCYQYQLR